MPKILYGITDTLSTLLLREEDFRDAEISQLGKRSA
jgi:hypothetical protein